MEQGAHEAGVLGALTGYPAAPPLLSVPLRERNHEKRGDVMRTYEPQAHDQESSLFLFADYLMLKQRKISQGQPMLSSELNIIVSELYLLTCYLKD